jgi:lipoprotein-anchoring transpeptidase ErfK/SrfK
MKHHWISGVALAILFCALSLTAIAPAHAQPLRDTAPVDLAVPVSAPGKVIYISISQQHMWAYENGKQVYSFVVSTGISTRATKRGNFRVQSKIPKAWSNIWQLSMPNWLGIYNVGTVENGIHALPINRRGVKLWAGLLGRPASFGCIILNDVNAAKLYKWAAIGTLVVIR